MLIVKRNGTKEEFNPEKIEGAILKAFKACNYRIGEVDRRNITEFISNLSNGALATMDDPVKEEISVEGIQNRVEKFLCKRWFPVGKAYMLYREQHKKIRDNVARNLQFIDNFVKSDNTANATIDDNSNVATHNIAVMNTEIHKENNKETNIRIWYDKIKELYGKELAERFLIDINTILYPHDLSSQIGMPYCVAITLYPFLKNGIKDIGGLSAAPKNIDSFCGLFVNLVFAIAAQYKGAVATPGMLLCMDYFLRKEWGDNYYQKPETIITSEHYLRQMTIQKQIHQYFQQICYSLMQPSGSRGNQACFWNLSIFDKPFFDTMYGDFYFPDGTKPKWESLTWLQKDFMHWLNEERLKCILTFPVVSLCLIYQNHKFLDEDLYQFAAKEYAEGDSFFTYISDSADSLSSCCRLSSKLSKPQFNFTNGQLSEMTGSKNVITLNLNRIIQDWYKMMETHNSGWNKDRAKESYPDLIDYIREDGAILDRVYKYQTAYNEILKYLYEKNLLTVYNAGFINMKKQYLTIGINGLNQAAEFLDMKCNKNKQYEEFCSMIFSSIKEQNALHKTKDCMFNTEFTPCESAAIKLYNRDKKDGYWVPKDTNLYASYIFKPNDIEIPVLDKIHLHGKEVCGDNLDGGSACHVGLDSHLDKEQYLKIIKYAAEEGCKYFTFNVPNSECDDCGFITKHPIKECPKCGSKHISYYDRVIGYLTKISNWSKGRQIEQKTRVYTKKEDVC
nr:MAG TPA: anaerobic ribonucleoside triphosphate reductase [Caudoviricetes sp.]